jgi:hypothetical protein
MYLGFIIRSYFFLPAFSVSWFKEIGSIGNSMRSYSIEQLIVETAQLPSPCAVING